MNSDTLKLKGKLSVFVDGKPLIESINTMTYVGLRWVLKQMSGWYGSYNRPTAGVRIGDGGGTAPNPLFNDPTLTDVRSPVIGRKNGYPYQEYVPYSTVSPLYCPDVFPREITIDSLFDMGAYNASDFPYRGAGDPFLNEAGLWVPPVGAGTAEDERPILVTYTTLKNSSGQLVSLPVYDTVEILFRWQILVS